MDLIYRIIIAGSRSLTVDFEALDYATNHLLGLSPDAIDCVISGLARGPDTSGKEWAYARGIKVLEFPANWDALGRSAGVIRNRLMAKAACLGGAAGHLLAFWDGESKGTGNMILEAHRLGLEVHVAMPIAADGWRWA